jgi:predicted DNA repair protein MutK
MAGSSLLALLDDIATLLDDISVMTKVAAKKTAGVLGDDLAVNAERVTGVRAERELPVVWAVAKGSAVNKLILVPAALVISAILPWAVTPLLMMGGAYLCYEGFEKLWHFFAHRGAEAVEEHEELLEAAADPAVDLVAFEKDKIKGAIRTDFILSAEIIVIALGTVQGQDLVTRIGVLSAIAVLMTIGVYGLVAGIVKLDDAGLYLVQREGGSAWRRGLRAFGGFILRLAPWLMKSLAVLGTIAMFLVGGGILVHGIPPVYDLLHHVEELAHGLAAFGGLLATIAMLLFNALFGILAGGLVLGAVSLAGRLRRGGGRAGASE